jgi:thiol-disulfide isomerase/thioredoxin
MNLPVFLKKNWSNIMILAIIALLFIPQTGMPIRVFLNRMISMSPSEVASEKRETLKEYHWPLQTPNGERTNLSVSEGKVVLINFWATWCPPCVAEMPSLQQLYDHYGDRVDFYFVSAESPDKIAAFMAKKGYSFPVYLQKHQAPPPIETNSLPTTYVISKDGEIVIDKTGAADWDSDTVKQVLDGLLND